MTKLKTCPFCGGYAEIVVLKKGFKSIIYCTTPECGFMRHSYNNSDTDENAARRLIAAWNRRADDGTVNMPDAGMMIEDASAPRVVDVVRCNNCKWFSNDTECKNCADIDDPCGYCRYFGACVRGDGYCYHGEMFDVFYEVEWYDSGDWNAEEPKKELDKYKIEKENENGM